MQRNSFYISAAFVLVAAVIVAVTFLLRKGDQEDEVAQQNEPTEAKGKQHDKKIPAHEQNSGNAGSFDQHDRFLDGMRNAKGATPPEPKEQPQEPPPKAAKSKEAQMQEQAMQRQIAIVYDDLFKELSLPEEQRQKLVGHLTNSAKAESELGPKILDPNIPVDDIIKLQEKLSQDDAGELGRILSPKEQSSVKQYQDELPKKMQKKELLGLMDRMGLTEAERENAQRVIERGIDRTEPPKSPGQMSRQEILELREKFAGKKAGDPEFMKASLEMGEAETRKLLRNLEDLPVDQYEKLKDQMEMPYKMMRQRLNSMPPR